MTLDELKAISSSILHSVRFSPWEPRNPQDVEMARAVLKLIVVAEAAQAHIKMWDLVRPSVEEALKARGTVLCIDPEFRHPGSLGLTEALAALEQT